MSERQFQSQHIYETVEAFLIVSGWRRVNPGEGWWYHEDGSDDDYMLGQALDEELSRQGVDTRVSKVAPRAY